MKIRGMMALLMLAFFTQVTVQAQDMPKPTEGHKILMEDVGHWKVEGTLHMGGGEKFKGEEHVGAVGQFWTVSHYSAKMFGQPFTGSSTTGYDSKSKKFVGTWVDSMNPGVTHMVGTFDKEKKTMTFETKGMGPDGKEMKGKIIVKYAEGKRMFEMWSPDMEGDSKKLVKTMEMTYTKVKSDHEHDDHEHDDHEHDDKHDDDGDVK